MPHEYEVNHPDMAVVRKDRIYRLNKKLDHFRLYQDMEAVAYFEKEIQIQKAYLQLEAMA